MPDEHRLVSDISEPCSKVPDLTGGKGSSLAVLDSIAREVHTVGKARVGTSLNSRLKEAFVKRDVIAITGISEDILYV